MMLASGRESAAKHSGRLKSACSGQARLSGNADGPGAGCWPLGRQAGLQPGQVLLLRWVELLKSSCPSGQSWRLVWLSW